MTCGTLLINNFNTAAVRKMPKYTKFYNYPGFFLKCQVRTRERFWHCICNIKNAQNFAELYFKGDKKRKKEEKKKRFVNEHWLRWDKPFTIPHPRSCRLQGTAFCWLYSYTPRLCILHSRQCTRVHDDGRNIGKTNNRSCNCTWWRGEGLRVLRQFLLELGTWHCLLFPIPSRLDPFGKMLLPLQRSILVPENMSEENGTALLPMFVGACLAARWLYKLRISECISQVVTRLSIIQYHQRFFSSCYYLFSAAASGGDYLCTFLKDLWFLQLPERQGFTNCKQAAGCITIPYCMCKKYVLAHTGSKSILYSFDAPHLGATFLRTGHEKFIPILEADMEEKNK